MKPLCASTQQTQIKFSLVQKPTKSQRITRNLQLIHSNRIDNYINQFESILMKNQSENTIIIQEKVYGFLCEQTNVFYAFESFEAYSEFLQWFSRQNGAVPGSGEDQAVPKLRRGPSQEEQLQDYEAATDQIMNIFDELRLCGIQEQIQLQEVDF